MSPEEFLSCISNTVDSIKDEDVLTGKQVKTIFGNIKSTILENLTSLEYYLEAETIKGNTISMANTPIELIELKKSFVAFQLKIDIDDIEHSLSQNFMNSITEFCEKVGLNGVVLPKEINVLKAKCKGTYTTFTPEDFKVINQNLDDVFNEYDEEEDPFQNPLDY